MNRPTGIPRAIIARFVALVIGLASCAAFAGQTRPLIDEAFVLSVKETMTLSLLSAPAPKLPPALVVALRYPPPESRRTRFGYWHTCGWGSVVYPAPRATKLPVDPVFILADGYRKCRSITASLLEPRVMVGAYPIGYFGDFTYEGVLVSDRLEFSDEPGLQQLFGLMVRLAKEPEDYWDPGFEWKDPDLKLTEYRDQTQFTPELVLEFVGETTVRLEINLTTKRLLVQSGERWEMYDLDQKSAAALKEVLTAEQARRRQEQIL